MISSQPISSKKEKIQEAAAQLFLAKGFVATSMRDIAYQVNLEVSSLYNHIHSKETILKSICYEVAEIYLNKIVEIERNVIGCPSQLEAILDLHIDIAIDYPISLLVFNDEWKHMNAKNKAIFVQWRKNYEKKLLNLIQNGINQGYIHDLNPDLIIHSILSLTQWAYKWMDNHKNRTKDCLKKDMHKLFLLGLQKTI